MESDKTVIRQLRWLVLVNSLDTARKSDRERIYFNLEEETFRMEQRYRWKTREIHDHEATIT